MIRFTFFFSALVLFCAQAFATECLEIASEQKTKEEIIAQKIIKEAYNRANLCVKFRTLPLKRAAIMLRRGAIDGSVWRSDSFIAQNRAKLHALKTPISTFTVAVIYNSETYPSPFQVSDLQQEKIGIRLGSTIAQQTVGMLRGKTIEAPYYEILLGMLKHGRLNAIVVPMEIYQRLAKHSPLPKNFKSLAQQTFSLRHVLSKKNTRFLLKLNKSLHDVITENSFQERLKEEKLHIRT
ncbi:exported hypothetical protein [Candidatus Terasakiella magnetica]|uniref:Uncharacterized protein n=1 Tax=Candidatus Terasakiella magnetica TaxID=1867952 RepID=A0A1C3RES8_9PROT|nr:transporter substrate-binding domain-containing protein [Candidatus Terasakiella magnetica]SCA55787.1 exported hypothetical protein [Candidatus Terasakiella magnetica]